MQRDAYFVPVVRLYTCRRKDGREVRLFKATDNEVFEVAVSTDNKVFTTKVVADNIGDAYRAYNELCAVTC